MMIRKLRPALLAFIALATLLAGCTVYFDDGTSFRMRIQGTFGVQLSNVIERFEPTRGHGSSYRVGEEIAFNVRTNRDGYLTLSTINSDGRVDTFVRNIYVRGVRTVTIDGADARHIFRVKPPRGTLRIRASFTPSRTDTSRVSYAGIRGEEAWTESITVELRPHDVRDVRETYIRVR